MHTRPWGSLHFSSSLLQVKDNFLPPLLEAILGDYQRNVPGAREPEVLSTVTAIVEKLEASGEAGVQTNSLPKHQNFGRLVLVVHCTRGWGEHTLSHLHVCGPLQSAAISSMQEILSALFECTLDMINKDLEGFPEHRINFFRMLQSVTSYCFPGKPRPSHPPHPLSLHSHLQFTFRFQQPSSNSWWMQLCGPSSTL